MAIFSNDFLGATRIAFFPVFRGTGLRGFVSWVLVAREAVQSRMSAKVLLREIGYNMKGMGDEELEEMRN